MDKIYTGNYNRKFRNMILEEYCDDVHKEILVRNVTEIKEISIYDGSKFHDLKNYSNFRFRLAVDIIFMVEIGRENPLVSDAKTFEGDNNIYEQYYTHDNYFVSLIKEDKPLSSILERRNPLYNLSKWKRNGTGLKKYLWNPVKMIHKHIEGKDFSYLY